MPAQIINKGTKEEEEEEIYYWVFGDVTCPTVDGVKSFQIGKAYATYLVFGLSLAHFLPLM